MLVNSTINSLINTISALRGHNEICTPHTDYLGRAFVTRECLRARTSKGNYNDGLCHKNRRGAGETASGLKTYDVTCKNGETYFLQNSPDGQWWAINADGNFDGLKGLKIDRAANAFCSSVMAQGQAQAPTPRNLSPAERLAMQLGPNKTAGCLSVSGKFIGLFSGGAPGSELAAARNLYIRYTEVFLGVSKLQDKSQFDAQMNGFRESVKQASPQDLKGYFESNCSQPEVNQLVQSGWK